MMYNFLKNVLIPTMILVLIFIGFGLTYGFGEHLCEQRANYVGLEYRYGFSNILTSGSFCEVLSDGRWMSSMTYYEYNNIVIK